MKTISFFALLTATLTFTFSAQAFSSLSEQATYYQGLYNNPSGNTSISKSEMNKGETRPKAILKGVYYFGGVDTKRDLLSKNYQNLLCENGFSQAYSIYNKVDKTVSCNGNDMNYDFIGQAKSGGGGDRVYNLMGQIYNIIKANGSVGPIYLHCWYGVHASNTISQMVLKQFCGISDSTATSNWDAIDIYDSLGEAGRQENHAKIRAFQPYAEFSITASEKATVCY